MWSTFVYGACDQASKDTRSYRVDIVPQVSPSETYRNWAPLLAEVGATSGVCFDLRIEATIPEFEAALLAGEPDFAFMNPYHAVMTHNGQQYIPLIADGAAKLSGIVVVRKSGAIRSLGDLKDQTVAFPSPNAFGASLLIRSELAREGIPIRPVYVKTHGNVYRSVIIGDSAAGGGITSTLDAEPEEIRGKLRIIYKTGEYMPHPFSANRRIPEEVREKVTQAFFSLEKSDAGRSLLKSVSIPVPARVDYDRDYRPLESLGLERFIIMPGQK